MNHIWGKPAFAWAATLLVAGALTACDSKSSFLTGEPGNGGSLAAEDPVALCDRLASAPFDPQRAAVAVSDAEIVPVRAVAACRAAATAAPGNARIAFQLGRALVAAGQGREAWESLRAARLGGSAAASFLLADGYRDGGLGQEQNFVTAATLYGEAAAGSVPGAREAGRDVDRQVKRLTFDPSLFQNADYMARLYEGRLSGADFPVQLAYYVQGIVKGFKDNAVIFQDQRCVALFSKAGETAIDNAELLAGLDMLANSTSPGDFIARALTGYVASYTRDYVTDQGEKDATVLYNPDQRYGCDSPVTQQIIANMMIMVRSDHGLQVRTPAGEMSATQP